MPEVYRTCCSSFWTLRARTLALQLTEAFKQPVVVDNRPGNSGIAATQIAVRANPDGYSVLLVPSTYGASAAFRNLPYDSLNDVTPIALFGQSGFVVTLHPSLPITSVRELIAHDKANPAGFIMGLRALAVAPIVPSNFSTTWLVRR
jgi:tripartite-type tricarboxylate transporter receptor subunit TctC